MKLQESVDPDTAKSDSSLELGATNPYRNHRELTMTEIQRLQQSVDETLVVHGKKNPVRRKTA